MAVFLIENSDQRKFIITFITMSFALFLFMYLNQQNLISRPVNTFTAHSVQAIADIFGLDSAINQKTYVRERGVDKIHVPTTILTVRDFRARIILECSAVHAWILLMAFVLSYPSTTIQKVHGIVVLTPVLIVFNAARIFVLMLFGHYYGANSSAFNILHIYIMRFLMIIVVIFLALIWLRWIDLRRHDHPLWFFLKFLVVSGILYTTS